MLRTNLPLGDVVRPQMWMIVIVAVAYTHNIQCHRYDNGTHNTTLNFILDAFLHPIIIIFSFHRDLSKEKVKKKRISGEAYDMNKQTTHTPI